MTLPPITPGPLAEVAAERHRQDEKWGEQNHPDLDLVLLGRPGGCTPERMADHYEMPTATRAQFLCQTAAARGECTWAAILVEEVAEAIGTNGDTAALRAELIQVAAVAVAWVEAIDRREFQSTRCKAIGDEHLTILREHGLDA